MPSQGPLRVGIALFEDVEELDFVGPWEVFGVAGRLFPGSVQTQLFSTGSRHVRGVYGLTVDCPLTVGSIGRLDIVIVPGGKGARAAKDDRELRLFLRRVHREGTVVASVCTGALVLAAADLLEGKRATTHASALEELRAFPKVTVDPQRMIDLGSVVTSAGISAGIDMALHLVERFLGEKEARQVAVRMEYPWPPAKAAELAPSGRS